MGFEQAHALRQRGVRVHNQSTNPCRSGWKADGPTGLRRVGAPGLTLLEVVVAVLIVALLVAVLVPATGFARRSAKRAACLSNLRQLTLSVTEYANDNRGKLFALMSPGSGTGFWSPTLTRYSTNLRGNILCKAAEPPAKNVGTASMAWGPHWTVENTNVGGWSGSYAINAWLYANKATFRGVACYVADIHGSVQIQGSLVASGGVLLSGTPSVGGDVIAGGSVSANGGASIGGTLQPYTAPAPAVPDVTAIYNQLAPIAAAFTGSTRQVSYIDFSRNPVVMIDSDAAFDSSLNGVTVVGTGTLLVHGNLQNLPNTDHPLNMSIICTGSIGASGNGHVTGNGGTTWINGSIYCGGNLTITGPTQINGIVSCTGSFTVGGNGHNVGNVTISGGTVPWFDPNLVRFATNQSINLATANTRVTPTFGDGIWAEASPSPGDPVPTDLSAGDINSQLGRFYIDRHGRAINVSFLDGHAETVRLTDLPGLKWQRQ